MNQDYELIKSFQNGNLQVFEELIKPHEKKIYNIALKLVKNEQDAYDLAQESLIKIYKSLNRFEYKSNFSTWIYRIAYNTSIDYLRKNNNNGWTMSLDEENENGVKFEVEDTLPTPEEIFEMKITKELIKEAVDKLDDTQRAVVVLRDVEGLSYEEISEVTDLNIGTVKSRINRGRKKLQETLIELFKQNSIERG